MKIEEQKTRVSKYFDESKDWQGDLYQAEDSYFSRLINRRKVYAIEMINRIPDLNKGKVLDVGFGSGVHTMNGRPSDGNCNLYTNRYLINRKYIHRQM